MGRRTLAKALAGEIGSDFDFVDCSLVKSWLDINGPFTSLRPNGGLILANLDRLNDSEYVRQVALTLETGRLEIIIGAGAGARTHTFSLPSFTMIGTSAVTPSLPEKVASFVTIETLTPYSPGELSSIAEMQARRLGFGLAPDAAPLIVQAAGNTPGAINSLLKRVQNYAHGGLLSESHVLEVLGLLGAPPNKAASRGLLRELETMTGTDFERWTASLFAKHGYTVKTTKVVGDHGIDLDMLKDGRKVVVQCKRWKDTTIGEPLIREFYGSMLNARAHAGVFVTTASFSPQARAFVNQKPITLLDLKALIDIYLTGSPIES